MIHPLFKLLASRPELLAAHLGGYAALLGAEAQAALAATRRQALLLALSAAAGLLGLGLAGVAALLAASLPMASMPLPWLLWALPLGLLLAAALGAWIAQQQAAAWTFVHLRQQAQADMALLREASPS